MKTILRVLFLGITFSAFTQIVIGKGIVRAVSDLAIGFATYGLLLLVQWLWSDDDEPTPTLHDANHAIYFQSGEDLVAWDAVMVGENGKLYKCGQAKRG